MLYLRTQDPQVQLQTVRQASKQDERMNCFFSACSLIGAIMYTSLLSDWCCWWCIYEDEILHYHLDDFDDRFDLNKSKNVSNVDWCTIDSCFMKFWPSYGVGVFFSFLENNYCTTWYIFYVIYAYITLVFCFLYKYTSIVLSNEAPAPTSVTLDDHPHKTTRMMISSLPPLKHHPCHSN